MITTSIEENPFYVLELLTSASPKNVERQKQKLLGMLELGLVAAKTFSTPLGDFSRSEESVRRAAAALENPQARIGWELWVASLAESSTEVVELGHALVLHYDIQKRALQGDFDDAEFIVFTIDELGSTWDSVFEGELLSFLYERTLEENGVESDDIFNSFVEQVTTDIAELIEAAPAFDLDDLESNVALEAAGRICGRAAELLESMTQSFIGQCQDTGTVSAQQAWVAIKKQYRKLTAGRGHYMHVLCFDAVYDLISDLAIEVFEQDEYIFAEALFIWLRDEAAAAGSDEVSEQHGNNARIAGEANAPSYADEYEEHEAQEKGGRSLWSCSGVLFLTFFLLQILTRADCGSASNDNDYRFDPAVNEQILREIRGSNQYAPNIEGMPNFESLLETPAE